MSEGLLFHDPARAKLFDGFNTVADFDFHVLPDWHQ